MFFLFVKTSLSTATAFQRILQAVQQSSRCYFLASAALLKAINVILLGCETLFMKTNLSVGQELNSPTAFSLDGTKETCVILYKTWTNLFCGIENGEISITSARVE